MIRVDFYIENLWAKNKFDNLFNRSKKISTNKVIEFEICYYSKNLFEFKLDINWMGRDHAGPEIEIGVFGYSAHLHLYDSRHWNHITNSWEEYNISD